MAYCVSGVRVPLYLTFGGRSSGNGISTTLLWAGKCSEAGRRSGLRGYDVWPLGDLTKEHVYVLRTTSDDFSNLLSPLIR